MRLIDANALKKEARRLMERNVEDDVEHYFYINAVEVAAINAAPTIDAVKVVRCKDCVYSRCLDEKKRVIFVPECMVCTNPHGCGVKYPEYDIADRIVMTNEYCYYGTKRQEEKSPRVCPACGAKMDGKEG